MRAITGSVVGREHVRLGKNNQDGVACATSLDTGRTAVVVTDGCSSGAFSEIGARLGAAWLARIVARADRDLEPRAVAEAAVARLCRALAALEVPVADYLLFGFLCAAIDERRAFVFGVGDGVYAVDGEVTALDPGPDNAPPYAAYALVGLEAPPPTVHLSLPASDVRSLVVATDGALDLPADEGLARFASDEALARNPSLLEKRLRVLGERRRLLRDDTTVAVLR